MNTRPMTLTQKILAHHARGLSRPHVQAGDVLQVRVDWTIASELAWKGMDRTYTALRRPALHDPERFFLAVDHTVDPVTLANTPASTVTEFRERVQQGRTVIVAGEGFGSGSSREQAV